MRLYGEFPKETEIGEVETLGAKGPFAASTCDPETGARSRKAAIPRHFAHEPGKSPFGGTGWWAREDGKPLRSTHCSNHYFIRVFAIIAMSLNVVLLKRTTKLGNPHVEA